MKTCSSCHTSLPHARFGKNISSADGLQSWCGPCKREAVRDARRERAQQVRANKTLALCACHYPARHHHFDELMECKFCSRDWFAEQDEITHCEVGELRAIQRAEDREREERRRHAIAQEREIQEAAASRS